MPALKAEVDLRLGKLVDETAPHGQEALTNLVQATLEGLQVHVVSVARAGPGRYLLTWQRDHGVLTEETAFTLRERAWL
jgi:hypothetical protein